MPSLELASSALSLVFSFLKIYFDLMQFVYYHLIFYQNRLLIACVEK